jgi:hypothetical protein
VNTSSLGCGLQDNLQWPSTGKNGADDALFFLDTQRNLQCEIRQYLERNLNADQIAHRLKLDPGIVDKYLSTLRSRL